MWYKEVVLSALTALRSNILRTALTMLGIVIGITSVILIIALGDGATKVITRELERFGANMIMVIPGALSDGSFATTKTLTVEDGEALLDNAGSLNITRVSPLLSISGNISANGETVNTQVIGTGETYIEMMDIGIAEGQGLGEEDIRAYARVAVLGPTIVKDLFGEGAEDILGRTVKIEGRSFRVIGVTEPKESIDRPPPDELVYVPYSTMMKIMLGQNYLQGLVVEASDRNLIDETVEGISALLRERHEIEEGEKDDFSTQSAKDILATMGTITGLLTALLVGIAAISLVVGGIGIMNIMLVTVTERTREIGLLKAIGARRRDILLQFLVESMVLTLVGGIVGMSLGIGLAFIITMVANIPFVLSPGAISAAVGVSSAVGIVFGYYPAQKAAKMSPIDALRYE